MNSRVLLRFGSGLVFTLAVMACGIAVAQSTNPRPMQAATDDYTAMLFKRDFAGLDKADFESRKNNAVLSDGQSRLAALYAGTGGCACGNTLSEPLWKLRAERLDEWVKRSPDSVTARVARASHMVYYAWFARGSGYSGTVSTEAWKLFDERMELARIALMALDAEAKSDPGWYVSMLWIGLAQKWPLDRYNALFEEAAKKNPGYLSIYFTAQNYHMQRWYGSDAEEAKFIDRAVDMTRAKLGETLYARLHWSSQEDDMFSTGRTDWKRMKPGFERIFAEAPDAWNLNNYAKFACMAGDWETLAVLDKKIGDKPVPAAWFDDVQNFWRCRAVLADIQKNK